MAFKNKFKKKSPFSSCSAFHKRTPMKSVLGTTALAAAKGAGGVTTAAGKAAFGKSMAVGLKGFTGKGILKSALGGSKLAGVVANQAPGIVAGQAISSLMSKGPQAQQPSRSTHADVNYSVKSPKDATTSMWHS